MGECYAIEAGAAPPDALDPSAFSTSADPSSAFTAPQKMHAVWVSPGFGWSGARHLLHLSFMRDHRSTDAEGAASDTR